MLESDEAGARGYFLNTVAGRASLRRWHLSRYLTNEGEARFCKDLVQKHSKEVKQMQKS